MLELSRISVWIVAPAGLAGDPDVFTRSASK
jgi:hypothetical protein